MGIILNDNNCNYSARGCLVDVSISTPKGYMEIIQQWDALTLLPIIQAHVAPDATINSNQWAAYNGRVVTDYSSKLYISLSKVILVVRPLQKFITTAK